MTAAVFLWRLGIAAILGAAVGFERQWRLRPVGMHTSSLVAIGAALFALLDVLIGAGDTTRIVAGVVTGVGFIAGGVIFRTGMSVSGLNTAATIWATAAVGALAGFGLWTGAVAGAGAIILFNVLLQPLAERIDERAFHRQRGETVYRLSIVCERQHQPDVGRTILEAISESPLGLQSLTRKEAGRDQVELDASIYSVKPEDVRIEALSAQLLAAPGVSKSEWHSTAA